MPFPLGTPPSYYATNAAGTPYNTFYVGETVVLNLSQATPNGYSVRDYYGNVVETGAVSGTTVTLTGPFNPGWYRVYYTGVSTDPTYGPSYGASMFLVIRSNANLLTRPAPGTQGNGAPGQHTTVPDFASRGFFGMAPMRSTITDATATSGNDSVAVIAADAPYVNTYWLSPGGAYLDPNRPRYQIVSFSGRSFDRLTVGTWATAYPADGTANAVADQIFVETTAGSSSGDKINVYYPNASTLVETYDNLASAAAAVAAVNGVSTRIWLSAGVGGSTHIAATAIGNAEYNGVKNCSNTLYPLGLHWFEGPINEPALDSSIGQKMKLFSAAVKAGNASAKVVGPCPVDIVTNWHFFFETGGHNYVDFISFHDYNTAVNGDMNEGRTQIESFLALKNSYAPSTPLWQTEAGYVATAVYGVVHPRRNRVPMMHVLLWEQYGLPRERNAWWQDFFGDPAVPGQRLNSDGTPMPISGLLRVLAAETWGLPHSARLDFGNATANAVFLGSIYSAGTTSTVVLLAASHIPNATVTLQITGTSSPLTVVDGFGNTSSANIVGGFATIPVDDIPTYVRIPSGASATVSHVNDWSAPASISTAATTATVGGTAAAAIADGGYMTAYNAAGGTGVYVSPNAPAEDAILLFPTSRPLQRVVIFCGPYWQKDSVLLDFDVDITTNGGTTWTTQQTVTKTASSFAHGTSSNNTGCSRETYFDEQWIFDVEFAAPVTANGVRVHVRATTFGGEPDAAAVAAGGQGNATQAIALEEIAVIPSVIAYSYQWQDSANGTTGWANIAGATSSSYTVAAGENGKYLRCVVTATDDGGAIPANSNVLGPAGATATNLPPHRLKIDVGIHI